MWWGLCVISSKPLVQNWIIIVNPKGTGNIIMWHSLFWEYALLCSGQRGIYWQSEKWPRETCA